MVEKPAYEKFGQRIQELGQEGQALQKTQSLFLQMFYRSTTSMCLYNPEGTIIKANSKFCKMFGVEEKAIISAGYNVFKDQAAIDAGIIPFLRDIFDRKETKSWEISFNIDSASKSTETPTSKAGTIFLKASGYPILNHKGCIEFVVLQHNDITERKIAEEALQKSEEKFRLAFQTSPDSINLNRASDGMYIDINEGFTKILGYTRDDVIGKTSVSLNIWKNSEDRKKMVDGLLKTGYVENLKAQFIGKNGKTRLGLMSARIIQLGGEDIILSVTRDITKLMKAEDALRVSEEKFRQIYENILDIYYEANLDGIILEISPSIEKISKYKREELIGKSLYDIYTNPSDRDRLIGILLEKGHARDYEINLTDKDGTQHICSMNIELIKDNENNPVKIVGICRDISDHKNAENEKIEAQKISGENEKLALVGQIAGKMAHDFNNILGIVMGNTELALLDCQEPKTKKTLELIYQQTIRGKNLTKNLVAFAKDQELKQEFFRISEKIDLVINLMRKDLEGIELRKEESPGVPELLADPGMIEHALVNLIQNSIHALSMVEHPIITVKTYSCDNHICFEIEDNGCGISKENLENIYEPSFTLKGSKDVAGSYKIGIKGTGYGMSNVKKYIDQHKGTISIESEYGAGTKFTISLPVIKKELTSEEKTEIQTGTAHFEKYILLVEDETAIADVQYRILTQDPCNHKVDIANNGQVAMDLFERNKYDLISLDYILPGEINGMDIYNHIRLSDKTIPILFISGNIEFLESIKYLMKKDPYVDHLSKPCKNIHYLNCINKLFAKMTI